MNKSSELEFPCPKCGDLVGGGTMEIKTNWKTGHKFYGCNNFPSCRYTEELEHEEDYEPGDSWSHPL